MNARKTMAAVGMAVALVACLHENKRAVAWQNYLHQQHRTCNTVSFSYRNGTHDSWRPEDGRPLGRRTR